MTTPYTVEALVVGLHLPWSGVWQRPNHVLTRLAKLLPVLVVEEPLLADVDADVVARRDGVHVLTPQRRTAGDAVDARAVRAVLAWLGDRAPAFWLYSPMLYPLAAAFPNASLVYDKMDQLSAFVGADPRIEDREAAVLARSAVVFAGGASLWNSVRARARRGCALPSGVDVAHFAAARQVPPHPALAGQARPLFGYVGVIDERLDLALLARLAEARPDATLVMVGPVAKIAPESLPRSRNIVYLGQRTYAELPALLGAFDVALMPFALVAATEFISPTKTLEYLAAGVPVVSTPVADVVAGFGDVVRIAAGSDAFIAAVADAEREPQFGRDAATQRVARATWDAVVERMLEELRLAGIVLAAPLARAATSPARP